MTEPWKASNPETYDKITTRCRFLGRYGITEDQYREMYDKLEGRCELCGEHKPYRKLGIDHNHITGKVRGLLCGTCNRGLGIIEKRMNLLDVYFYLSRPGIAGGKRHRGNPKRTVDTIPLVYETVLSDAPRSL